MPPSGPSTSAACLAISSRLSVKPFAPFLPFSSASCNLFLAAVDFSIAVVFLTNWLYSSEPALIPLSLACCAPSIAPFCSAYSSLNLSKPFSSSLRSFMDVSLLMLEEFKAFSAAISEAVFFVVDCSASLAAFSALVSSLAFSASSRANLLDAEVASSVALTLSSNC